MRKSRTRWKGKEKVKEETRRGAAEAGPSDDLTSSAGAQPSSEIEAGVKAQPPQSPEPTAGARPRAEKQSPGPKDRVGALEALNKELQEKKEHLEDRLLRLAAEFDNYRKRTAREFQQVVENANKDLILQLIDVLDNFQRALDSAKSAKDFDAFHKGVELIYTHLHEILTRQGLEPIEAVGQPFDPHLHEAVMQVDDDQHPPDTVVDQMQPGYLLREKLLRAPRVIVSRDPGEKERPSPGAE